MLISFSEFIGHFHPALVHLPIGIFLLALMLQWLSRKEQYGISHEVMKAVWMLGVCSALLSCITGYLLSLSGDYDDTTVSWHMWMGITLAIVSVLIYIKVAQKKLDWIFNISCFFLLILIFVTGHLGGTLTHGANYLSWNAGNKDTTSAPQKIIGNVQEAKAYAQVIQPILQSRCYGCHGPTKQKGGFRMDDSIHLMKGGKDGITLIAGEADKSEMIKRLMLPKEEDHHMPPKEKKQLSESEIALIHWWIDGGADFSKRVKDLPQSEAVKTALMSLQKPQKTAPSYIPFDKVEAADQKAIEALKQKGIAVLPVAQNSSYLMVNFVTALNLKDDDIKLILPIKKQLVWLKLSDTKVDDTVLAIVAQCTNLRILQLNNTSITDKGILQLRSLKNLQSISLVGTPVTASGVQSLQAIKTLREIFLYQTNAAHDLAFLKTTFPKTVIDTGGYSIPFITTDTVIVKPPKK